MVVATLYYFIYVHRDKIFTSVKFLWHNKTHKLPCLTLCQKHPNIFWNEKVWWLSNFFFKEIKIFSLYNWDIEVILVECRTGFPKLYTSIFLIYFGFLKLYFENHFWKFIFRFSTFSTFFGSIIKSFSKILKIIFRKFSSFTIIV